jgi:hypothetical protein
MMWPLVTSRLVMPVVKIVMAVLTSVSGVLVIIYRESNSNLLDSTTKMPLLQMLKFKVGL